MSVDRPLFIAAMSYAKPLYQNRTVCVVGGDKSEGVWRKSYLRDHGANEVTMCSDAGQLSTLTATSVDLFIVLNPVLDEQEWQAVLKARATTGVVLMHTAGDAAAATQALAQRFASVERAEVVRGEAAWVGPPGAVSATVAVEQAATRGSWFVCAERPQRLALGSVCVAAPAFEAQGAAAAVPQSLGSLVGDLNKDLEDDRLAEVEARLTQTMDDLVQAQLVAAQALAERDSLKRKLELARADAAAAAPVPAPVADDAGLAALRDELVQIEALVARLPRGRSDSLLS